MDEFKGLEMIKKFFNVYTKLLSDVARKNNLTLNQLQILLFLNKNDKSNIAKNIVNELGVTKSHVSMSVANLEKDGYIEKLQDENDKKIFHLHITKKSKNIINEGEKVQKKVKEIMFDGIDDNKIGLLIDISKKMQNNLENYNKNYGGNNK